MLCLIPGILENGLFALTYDSLLRRCLWGSLVKLDLIGDCWFPLPAYSSLWPHCLQWSTLHVNPIASRINWQMGLWMVLYGYFLKELTEEEKLSPTIESGILLKARYKMVLGTTCCFALLSLTTGKYVCLALAPFLTEGHGFLISTVSSTPSPLDLDRWINQHCGL